MELPTLGRQCANSSCKQLDFLPIQCKCGEVFCSDHYQAHNIDCTIIDNKVAELNKIEGTYKCSESGCKSTSIVPLICDKCNKHFCIQHRHLVACAEKDSETLAAERERYAAPIRQFNTAKNAIDKQVNDKINNAKKDEKKRHMANKLQLMRIKNKAIGLATIPSTDRVYFNIEYPKGHIKTGACPVFVSQTWSLGRSIDAIANSMKLQNNNNIQNEKKLRLFRSDNKNILSTQMSTLLESLLQKGDIMDGENLIIEYVDEHCIHLN